MTVSIKAWFGDWHQCTEEEALKFCQALRSRSNCEEAAFSKAMNARHLKGATYEELHRRHARACYAHTWAYESGRDKAITKMMKYKQRNSWARRSK